jgi:hypothetical protein
VDRALSFILYDGWTLIGFGGKDAAFATLRIEMTSSNSLSMLKMSNLINFPHPVKMLTNIEKYEKAIYYRSDLSRNSS